MSAIRSADALDIIRDAYGVAGGESTKPKLWYLRQEQLDMIEQLADRYGESQVSILRSIIDEWRTMKMREGIP